MKKYDTRRGAYYGDPAYKTAHLRMMRKHELADSIIQRTFGARDDAGSFRGCSVGCVAESLAVAKIGPPSTRVHVHDYFNLNSRSDPHTQTGIGLNVPSDLMSLNDSMFELLSRKECVSWPREFLRALNTGADYSSAVDACAVAVSGVPGQRDKYYPSDEPAIYYLRRVMGRNNYGSGRYRKARRVRPIIVETLKRIKAPRKP